MTTTEENNRLPVNNNKTPPQSTPCYSYTMVHNKLQPNPNRTLTVWGEGRSSRYT